MFKTLLQTQCPITGITKQGRSGVTIRSWNSLSFFFESPTTRTRFFDIKNCSSTRGKKRKFKLKKKNRNRLAINLYMEFSSRFPAPTSVHRGKGEDINRVGNTSSSRSRAGGCPPPRKYNTQTYYINSQTRRNRLPIYYYIDDSRIELYARSDFPKKIRKIPRTHRSKRLGKRVCVCTAYVYGVYRVSA